MDLAALSHAVSLRSVSVTAHAELPEGYVLCGKLIACAWLVTGHAAVMPTRWLCAVAVLACFVVLTTPWFRLGSAALAISIGLGTLIDASYFANNRLFCAALLAAFAISDRFCLWLPRVQVALLYFGAGIDKLLDADWRSGQFLSSFVAELARFGVLWSPARQVGAANMPARWAEHALHAHPQLAAAGSWAVIAIELGLALAFLRGARAAAHGSAVLHGAIFALTGSSFGMFLYAGLAATLLVAPKVGRPIWYWCALAMLAGPWTEPLFGLLLAAAAVADSSRRLLVRAPLPLGQVARER